MTKYIHELPDWPRFRMMLDATQNYEKPLTKERLLGWHASLFPKWARIAKCSQDTALRDILDLVKRGILTKDSAGGRSASYSLKELS